MRLTFRKLRKIGVQRGEPDRRLPISTMYYTAIGRICKYSIMTKIDRNFCEKAYEVEKNAVLFGFFGAIPDGHFCRTKIWKLLFSKSSKNFKKALDKRIWM